VSTFVDRRAILHRAVDVLLREDSSTPFLRLLEIYAAVLDGSPLWPGQEDQLRELLREAESKGIDVSAWARTIGQ
jgi:hypothetical protein